MNWTDLTTGDDEQQVTAGPGSVWPLVVCVVAADVLAIVGALWPYLS